MKAQQLRNQGLGQTRPREAMGMPGGQDPSDFRSGGAHTGGGSQTGGAHTGGGTGGGTVHDPFTRDASVRPVSSPASSSAGGENDKKKENLGGGLGAWNRNSPLGNNPAAPNQMDTRDNRGNTSAGGNTNTGNTNRGNTNKPQEKPAKDNGGDKPAKEGKDTA